MGKDIKEQSTEELKKKVKTGRIILTICWSAVVITLAVALLYGKTQVLLASAAGILGLGVVTIAMLIGGKKIRKELAQRSN